MSPAAVTMPERNRLEIIRFASADAQRKAIRALLDFGMLNFAANCEEEWLVRGQKRCPDRMAGT